MTDSNQSPSRTTPPLFGSLLGLGLGLGLTTIAACGDDVAVGGTFAPTATATATDTEATEGSTTMPMTGTDTHEATDTESVTASGSTTQGDTDTTTTGSTDTDTATTGTSSDTTTTGTTGTTSTTGGGVDSEICLHLGAVDGIAELNTAFIAEVLLDSRINAYFLNSNVDSAGLITCLNEQIAEEVGCADITYSCVDMKTAHTGMGVSALDFADMAEDFGMALDEHQTVYMELTDDDKAAILAVLVGMAGDIVEDANSDQTVYQRVGRKPAYTAMVGNIGESNTWIDRITKDFTINGFFLESDFVRLNTCFTRHLAALDGPVTYGAEVDSPGEGVDPGVALDDPCVALKLGHEGMKNPNKGDAPVTYEDFVSLVSDLSGAMASAGWSQADHDAVLAAMSPLCSEVVADVNDCPGNAQTVLVKKNKLGLDIPDDAYDGSLASMVCVAMVVIDDGINIVDLIDEIEVGISHGQVGDLVIRVQSPSGIESTLMSRPGYAEADDDGEGVGGDTSKLKTKFPVVFRDAGLVDAELMGIGNVVCQDDGLCDYFPNPGASEGVNLSDFVGEQSNGTWRICFADAEPGATGFVDEVSLVLSKVKFAP